MTIPHKENLLRLAIEQAAAGEAWEISPVAFGAGAANTLAVRDDGTRFVDNTDALALKSLLREALPDGLEGVPIVVLGAGGVGAGRALRCLRRERA
ncbi:MAG: hypothetical protein ACFHWZ_03310 [Phycisphaerales bacterium]